ncbi:type IV secretory system conjugative DNA transfer family protein [Streptomyces sp. ME08-AFT2]|uniref:type IV secretory system conjugative DNA transfer family protein n=1 Tax=Streptomyces sp. ME08-AFT2 TaxID=3028683 RepID=UPI0029B01957|nr:type IV secretory system conjugative DNA transfer family protein [Streptomyces sp. ME08-AFT2]MDX3315019.1 type IV secretory system conjugative DNA transfer family protein [Streptomyces sp. ME08-AFT2]
MRPSDGHRHDSHGSGHGSGQGSGQGGVPDGLLVGILAFLLGMTLLVWTATGLSALLAHGSWPPGVTFTRTPLAMRHLIAEPHDVPGAWPDADATQFSGYGLFWGLLIGQLMILLVLTVFVMGTLARWRAVRAHRRADRTAPAPAPQPQPQPHEVPTPRTEATPTEATPTEAAAPGTRTEPAPHTQSVAQPVAPAAPPTDRHTLTASPSPSSPSPEAVPAPSHGWEASRTEAGTVHYAPPAARYALASQAVRDAQGPALVLTSDPALWQDTKDGRAKLGPVHLYDPAHRCDTPARLHWSPIAGCEDRPTAASRAAALLTPVRPTARLDQTVAETAETLLRSYLHAAAIDGRTVRHVHRWSQGTGVQEAVRALRTNPKAAPGAAGELEAALTAHPERRDIAQELTARALSALSTVNIREACTPNRTDALALDSFVDEGGTLYVLGESLEDPRTSPGAMPLLTALVSSVVERGRRMAERSSSGRLDPPLTVVLDDVAAVAPIPQLPDLLSAGTDRGLPTLALLRSREQARARWPHHDLPV